MDHLIGGDMPPRGEIDREGTFFALMSRTLEFPDESRTLNWTCEHEHVTQEVLTDILNPPRYCVPCREAGHLCVATCEEGGP